MKRPAIVRADVRAAPRPDDVLDEIARVERGERGVVEHREVGARARQEARRGAVPKRWAERT